MTMDFRSELNGKEKVAQALIGMESTGTPIVVNGQRADVILANEKKSKFNNKVDEYIDKFEKHNKALEDYAKEISKDINGLEILPMGSYALIKPFDENPFQKVTVKNGTVASLALVKNTTSPSFKNSHLNPVSITVPTRINCSNS